jgi:hypothetical protein
MEKTGKLWITYPNAHTAPVAEDDIVSKVLRLKFFNTAYGYGTWLSALIAQ